MNKHDSKVAAECSVTVILLTIWLTSRFNLQTVEINDKRMKSQLREEADKMRFS